MKKITLILIIAALVWGAFYFHHNTEHMLVWIQSMGWMAPVFFLSIYFVASTCFFPTVILTLTAGALFGTFYGGVLSLVGATLGAVASFLLSQKLFGDWLNAAKHSKVYTFVHGVDQYGWRFVALLRLIPIIPFSIVNYGLGLTAIPLLPYAVATACFLIPLEFVTAYFGFRGWDFIIHPYTLLTPSSGILLIGIGLLLLAVHRLGMFCKQNLIHPPESKS